MELSSEILILVLFSFFVRGASPNDVTKRKFTPLHFACIAGRSKNAEILLQKAKSSMY